MHIGIELFERAAEAGGQVLKAQYIPAPSARGAESVAALLLTFDIGRILLATDPMRAEFEAEHIPTLEATPPGMLPGDEEEPWWRVLGNPLTRVQAGREAGSPLRLQFRGDEDNPRRILLTPFAGRIDIALENPPA